MIATSMIAAWAALLLAGQPPASAAPPATTLTIKSDHALQTLDATALAALPHEAVAVSDHGKTHHYSGVPAALLLGRIGAPTGEALRGKEMTGVVIAVGSDGYRAAFSLAEIDPGMKAAKTIVADREDGLPLTAKDGPFKLVVEGDLRPARSVHNLAALELVRMP